MTKKSLEKSSPSQFFVAYCKYDKYDKKLDISHDYRLLEGFQRTIYF